jgi:hypothetical protein
MSSFWRSDSTLALLLNSEEDKDDDPDEEAEADEAGDIELMVISPFVERQTNRMNLVKHAPCRIAGKRKRAGRCAAVEGLKVGMCEGGKVGRFESAKVGR